MANRGTSGRPSLATLFLSFLTIGSTSFGGGLLGWIRRELVERRRWIDDQQFLVCYGLSQMVPGATNVNLSVIIGTQLRGIPGALVAVAGLLLIPLAILLVLGTLYFAARGVSGSHPINAALAGAGAAAIGFNLATGIRLARHNIRRVGPALVAGAISGRHRHHAHPAAGSAAGHVASEPRGHPGAAHQVMTTLLQIAAMFSLLSLLAFGGGAAVLPDMQRQAVEVHHWVSSREFLDMFALSRAIPPGSMIVVLIGQKAAGVLGGLMALLAMFGPSSLLAFAVGRLWHRAGAAAWRETLEQALAPVSIGVTIASGIALARSTEHDWATYAVTAATTLLLALTRLHPLLVMGAGALFLVVAGG